MRNISAFLFLGLAMFARLTRADDFDDAGKLYEEGKFAEAKQVYEQLIERGEWSANTFYNLGNAEFRSGAPGRAILNYERALTLEQSHAEARANLQWLRERSASKVPALRWWEHVLPPVSSNVLAVVAAVAVWVALFGATLAMFGRKAWGGVVCALLVAGYAAAAVWWRDRDRALAIVTSKEAVARLAPADRASVAESLLAGSRVRVLSERGDWVYCALPGGGLGWITAEQLQKVQLDRS